MKLLVLITLFLFINYDAVSAESTVKSFQFSFTMPANQHKVVGRIIQNPKTGIPFYLKK